jgi:hypothetical protein
MRLRWLAAFALVVSTTASADEPKQEKRPKPADSPAGVSVTCEVVEVWASHGKGTVDPKIDPRLAKQLGNTLKQSDLKQLSANKVTLTAKKAEPAKLAKGSATITLVETVNKAQARITVDFNAAKGNAKDTRLVAAGDWVVTSVNQSKDAATADAHVLGVGNCK